MGNKEINAFFAAMKEVGYRPLTGLLLGVEKWVHRNGYEARHDDALAYWRESGGQTPPPF